MSYPQIMKDYPVSRFILRTSRIVQVGRIIGTGNTVRVKSIHGTVVARVKTTRKGAGVMTTDTNPRVSAPMTKCALIAWNPRHKLRWTTPSQQQQQHESTEETENTNIV